MSTIPGESKHEKKLPPASAAKFKVVVHTIQNRVTECRIHATMSEAEQGGKGWSKPA